MDARPWTRHYDYWVPPHMNYPRRPLYEILRTTAVETPDKPATGFLGAMLTFGDAGAVARGLLLPTIPRGAGPQVQPEHRPGEVWCAPQAPPGVQLVRLVRPVRLVRLVRQKCPPSPSFPVPELPGYQQ